MKKRNYFRSFFLAATLAVSSLAFTSCDSNDSDGPSGAYAEDGVFVLNEGNFRESNASISFYSNSTEQAQQNVFQKENDGRLLGDVVQDMELAGNRAFIVMNNSNKIEVVNAATFKSVGVVEGLSAPRYFVALNNEKGYVTEWFPPNADWSYNRGRVSVIDLKTYKVVKTIEVDVQPEQLLLAGGNLYVANSGTPLVHVIDTNNDMVVKTIEVTHGPNSLALDRNNNLWVLSSGYKDWNAPASEHTAGALSKINIANNTVTSTITFPEATASASKLLINGNKDMLYFLYNGAVHQQDINATALNTTPLINRSFYGLGVDPETGNIYGGDENSFDGDGTVYIYNPQGNQIGSFRAGIGPNGFVFN
ncbi:L-dopachrome tautomerase-related protein [Pontibacter litorisediminis]|uniref:L-dopachrome tautomerase-related protein n=1 Tax=Pontibacter litorisediminis TaxID=1846260 RepID=UPI0023EC4BDC|nr:L-dopachrome tautomerase-related protein [Pontibacter litorisediminis]